MTVSFNILRPPGLVYVRYEGDIRIAEICASIEDYVIHPECRPGQKQLIDLSRVTGFDFETDPLKLIELQARKADVCLADGAQVLVVYYAPGLELRKLANLLLRTWEPFPGVVAVIQENEADALSILGLREASFAELLEGKEPAQGPMSD